MLKLTWIEFFLRIIPETFMIIFGICVISKKIIKLQPYIFSSILLAILIFFVRWLPIYFGVHMIINIILTISIVVISGIRLIKAICSTLLITFMFSLSEFLNMIMLRLLKIDTNTQMLTPFIKSIVGLPSLIILFIFIIIINYLLKMKEGIKNVNN